MKPAFFLAVFLLLGTATAASGTAKVKANTGLSGVKVEASQVLQTDARTLWGTITDYNRLATFIPDMVSSRVISAPGAPKRVEQIAEAGLFAFVMPDQVVLALEETPYSVIRFRAISGKLVSMTGEWRIVGDKAPVTLFYRAHIVPMSPIPPLGSGYFVEDEVRARFEAVGREAERRTLESRRGSGYNPPALNSPYMSPYLSR
jgi:ribosome-associated toxin RatA of RatAB toxin-antitoxin module